jgi:hypothetical protein
VFANRQRESRPELADYWQIARLLVAAENVLVRVVESAASTTPASMSQYRTASCPQVPTAACLW